MAVRDYIKTIEDLERIYYDSRLSKFIQKADAPVLTTTAGVYNPIFGLKVWSQLNQEVNAFSLLPKQVWDRSGWRVITARASTPPTGGVGEAAALPFTTRPTWATLTTTPKTIAHNFDVSETVQFLGKVDDGLGDTMAFLREYMGKEHTEHINRFLLTNMATAPAATDILSIDRVVSGHAEATIPGMVAGRANVYGLDRQTAPTWADAFVDHNNGTARTFTLSLIDNAIANIMIRSGKRPNVILTGYDTLERIVQEQQVLQRYTNVTVGTRGIEDAKTAEGIDTGINVASYRDIPIIASKDVVQDTISRVYLLNTEDLFLKVAKPTQYFESGIETGDPFGINKLAQEGMYRTMCELICTMFRSQGKIRDLR